MPKPTFIPFSGEYIMWKLPQEFNSSPTQISKQIKDIIARAEAEVQRLELENRAFKEQYLSEIEMMKEKLQDIQEDNSPHHQTSAIKSSLRDLRDFNERMVEDLERDHHLGE